MSALTKFQEIVAACHNAKDPHCVGACGEDNVYTGPPGSGSSQALCCDCVEKVEAMLREEAFQAAVQLTVEEIDALRERVHADECDGDPCLCGGNDAEAILLRVSPREP